MIHIYSVADHLLAVHAGRTVSLPLSLDALFAAEDPSAFLKAALAHATPAVMDASVCAPIQSQEVWAAGVTYFRSMTARKAESREVGGDSFYDRVYSAERPELFFKATPHRVVGPGQQVKIRRDSKWNVPEPELTLAFNKHGRLFGYTIGNDMSSRDIEGENPLYLPQAKVYSGSAALGPALLVTDEPLPPTTQIAISIQRRNAEVFAGATTIDQIKRTFASLGEFLFRDNEFPHGCYLMTGTGIVPPDNVALRRGDTVAITVSGIGTLQNTVA